MVLLNSHLGKHSVVLNLTLPDGRGVAGNDDQLTRTLPQGLQGLLVSKNVLS